MSSSQKSSFPFGRLKALIKGDLLFDKASLVAYATDASAYRERPLGVVRPRDADDVGEIIAFARAQKLTLIPRAAGTSLAGQVVGGGLVVDISRYMTRIVELNAVERWVRVEPGVVLDELNQYLRPYGLMFGPETSTSSRCMIGGMVGNNSCGAHSIIYGSTRDHLIEVEGYLANGDKVVFGPLTNGEFDQKCRHEGREGEVYRGLRDILSHNENRKSIQREFPHSDIHRRNTGYALDLLLDTRPFNPYGEGFNMCKLIAGSEGTLFFATSIKIGLVELPPEEKALVCVHMSKLEEAFEANLVALESKPDAVELMDKTIMDLTKDNALQLKNRFFVQGDPAALLLVEFSRDSRDELEEVSRQMIAALEMKGFGYAYPVLYGKDIGRVWNLRKAGLGVLSNMPGDKLPVPVIEDTAVRPADLPAYVKDVQAVLARYGKECVYYAHIGTGELHLRPVLNMKKAGDVQMFYDIAHDVARVVKSYKGSLSGEHGDGRLRGEFIPLMVGEHNYGLFQQVKHVFDPDGLFNPGKITATPPMNTSLRYGEARERLIGSPVFSWDKTLGVVRAAERCNGSGDCRKSHLIGGTMCPSYMGSRDERQTTRARANMLRELFTGGLSNDRLGFDEVKGVLDLCLSCKACKTECPSNVDMSKLKAEFMNEYHKRYGVSFRSRMIAALPRINRILIKFHYIYNICVDLKVFRKAGELLLGFSSSRSLPKLQKISLRKWFAQRPDAVKGRKVLLFVDEFSNYNDSDIGIKCVMLLEKLGYTVVLPEHRESGRTFLSKGLLEKAAALARYNIDALAGHVGPEVPIVGIEPSAILTLRDEYLELAGPEQKAKAVRLARYTMTFEEFMAAELDAGRIDRSLFTDREEQLRYHSHCYQKTLSDTTLTKKVLEIPVGYTAVEIPSGCCGMAGSFGYEKEHYDLSVKIGELVLFPDVRANKDRARIVAPGTSCRHQIKDGTGVQAGHPVELLFEALK